jgi:DNA polymerase-3 subunit delta'
MFFTNIVGHEFQKEALKRMVSKNRISHAYLFFGPDGVGKKLIAIEFAKILNCLCSKSLPYEGSKGERCECYSCKKIEKGIHPDVFLVEYKGLRDIKVDQIRKEVEERLYLKPFEGKFKMAIVDEAERMNLSSQNAFLKTLEEPPEYSVIILITSKPQALLPTVRSRCQLLEFKALSEEIMLEEIKKRNTDLSPDEIQVAIRLSGGSLGKALSLDKSLLSERKEIIIKLSSINPKYASQVLGFVESILRGLSSEDTEKLSFIFQIISLWLRDLVLIKIGFSEDALSNRDLVSITREFADRWSVDNILDKMRFLENAWYAIFRGNANKQIVLENLILKITE